MARARTVAKHDRDNHQKRQRTLALVQCAHWVLLALSLIFRNKNGTSSAVGRYVSMTFGPNGCRARLYGKGKKVVCVK